MKKRNMEKKISLKLIDPLTVGASKRSNIATDNDNNIYICLLYTSPSPRDRTRSRMPSSA